MHWCGHVEASVGCKLFHLQPGNQPDGFAVLSAGRDVLPPPPEPFVPVRELCFGCSGGVLHCYGSARSCECHCTGR
jgi:hypothetical protein